MNLNDIIAQQVQATMRAQAAEIERQLQDHDVVVVPYGDQHIIYRVPRWSEHPIRRARIAWLRWRRQ